MNTVSEHGLEVAPRVKETPGTCDSGHAFCCCLSLFGPCSVFHQVNLPTNHGHAGIEPAGLNLPDCSMWASETKCSELTAA